MAGAAAVDGEVGTVAHDAVWTDDRTVSGGTVGDLHPSDLLARELGDFIPGDAAVDEGLLPVRVMMVDHRGFMMDMLDAVASDEVPVRMVGMEMTQGDVGVVIRGESPFEVNAHGRIVIAETKAAAVAGCRGQGSPSAVGA